MIGRLWDGDFILIPVLGTAYNYPKMLTQALAVDLASSINLLLENWNDTDSRFWWIQILAPGRGSKERDGLPRDRLWVLAYAR